MDTIDKNFLKENINNFIDIYFKFNPDHLNREKQFRQRWYNSIGEYSPNTKDRTAMGTSTILYIQYIIKNDMKTNNETRQNRIEKRKKQKDEKDLLNKKIDDFKNYTEYNWRKITNTFRRYIIENDGETAYEQLVDEQLNDLKEIPRTDNFKRNIKSYHGI